MANFDIESAKSNWGQYLTAAVGTALISGGVSFQTHNATEGADRAAIERIERELAELDDLDDELDELRALQREETRERSRMIREAIRDMRQEIRQYATSGGGYEAAVTDYYMLEAPAMAEEAPEVEAQEPE